VKVVHPSAESIHPQKQSPENLRDSPQRWVLATLLFSGMVFCYAQRGALSVAAKDIMQELGLTKADMGVLLSAFFWSYSLMQVPAGWVVDRHGVKRSYAVGYFFWSLASLVTGLAKSLLTLNILRMLLGIGQSVAFPASARAVANWFHDRERGTVTATYLTGVRLGQALVSLAAAAFLPIYGWKWFFFVIGVVSLLWLLPWYLFLRKWETIPATPSATKSGTAAGRSFAQSLLLLRNRTVFGIFLGFFAYDYAWFVYLTWLPGYLEMERGFSKAEMGIYSSIPYVAMSVIIMLSGIASDWLIRQGYRETLVRKIFITAGLAIGCLIVPAGMVEDKMTSVWLLTISLCGLGLCSPNTWTLTQAVCSKNIVGTVSGIQNFGGNVGGVIAPALTGYIAHATESFALALSITGAICVVGILSYLILISEKVSE
jgi:ACS family D-galactonate transporter-like MFS transporter